jgi:hypothetical protein
VREDASLGSAPLCPPDGKAAAPATDSGEVLGEDEEAKRHHPKAENGQETEQAAADQGNACCHSSSARPWKRHANRPENQAAFAVI